MTIMLNHETLELPVGCVELIQAETGGHKLTLGATSPPNEAEVRAWVAAHGEAEEGEVLALVTGCQNPLYLATEGELARIVLVYERMMTIRDRRDGQRWFDQFPENLRDDLRVTLALARAAQDAMRDGKTVWLGHDDKGYYFRNEV